MSSRRSGIVSGILLIVLGLFFFALQTVPVLGRFVKLSWPVLLVGAGVGLFVLALIIRVPGLAVPAAIITGVGGLLYYQNATGNWASWAYAWTLMPAFVGVGLMLSGILSGKSRSGIRSGLTLLIISAVLFTIFSYFLGGSTLMLQYWPISLILIGLAVIIRAIMRR